MERNWFTFKIFLAIIAIQIAPKLTFVQNSAAVQHFASAISIRSNSEDFDNCKVQIAFKLSVWQFDGWESQE